MSENIIKRDFAEETKTRVAFIREVLESSNATGIVYGNSGGKDSALVGILCKMACDNTVGVIMPCSSKQNYNSDRNDGIEVGEKFAIETREVDLTAVKSAVLDAVSKATSVTDAASANIAPRLRMTTLYAIAASENRIVAGTGNKSEAYLGYFTKWGDGAHDFNPIADLTVGEIFDFLRYLDAPQSIITKAPSAGLFDGQTDEKEMGVSYASVDKYIFTGEATESDKKVIDRLHSISEHKRNMPLAYTSEK